MAEQNFDGFIQKLEELQANIQEAGKGVTDRAVQEGKREAKDKTPTGQYKKDGILILGGTLKKGWHVHSAKRVGDGWKGGFYNDVFYGPYVNFGHRIVRNGVTIGYVPGKFLLEAGVAFMENHLKQYWEEEIQKAKRKFEK